MGKKVIIVGGGIGGLATANILAKAGYSVSVYEKNDQLGGRAGSDTIDGFTFDTGPSWYLMPKVFEQYFSLFGKSAESELELIKLQPAYKVFFETDEPITITGESAQDETTFEQIERGSGRKLREYVKKGNVIYQLSLQHFLYTNFTSFKDFLNPTILRNSLTMLRLALTPIDAYVRKFVKNERLLKVLEYPMVFLGSSPFSAPAIYSLMSALDFEEGVYYPKNGIYSIIERLVKIGTEQGVEYHYGSNVTQIVTENGVSKGILLADGTNVSADIIVSNADLHFTETKLLKQEDQSYPQRYWDKKEAGPSAILMYLGVKDEIPNLEHHNLFFVDNWKENFNAIFNDKAIPFPASLYICKPSATDTKVAPAGNENVFVLVPLPAGVSVDQNELDTLSDKFIDYIEDKLEIPDFKSRLVVRKIMGPNDFASKFNSWENSALGPSHVLRQSAIFRTPNKSKKVKNLYYVGGSTAPGIGLPMCLIGAELIYKRLAGDSRGGPIKKIERLVQDNDA